MTIIEVANMANSYTDENFSVGVLLGYANAAISKINITIKTNLPLFDSQEEYTALNSNWINMIVVPFVCWSIKMNDSSINEANVYLFQYEEGLKELSKQKSTQIDEEYQGDGFKNSYPIKRYEGMPNRKTMGASSKYPLGK